MLARYTTEIITGLLEKGVWPVSYACDGTEKERATQRKLQVQAHSTDIRRIGAPSADVDDITINIPLFEGKPMALVQDSLHARKTWRNNIHSGTKTMVLGDFPILYKHLRDLAFNTDSPLYRRDVEKTDKQDDRAAARVQSSDTLHYLLKSNPDGFGTAIFLFIGGELTDAVQSRSLPISERIQMLLRSNYFLTIWQKFLDKAQYPPRRACLSREALDISNFVIEGNLSLIFIYRDYFDGSRIPLLPWLHSTEPCEHTFGECRKQVKDFDFATFLHMMPRTHWMIRISPETTNTTGAKGRASGYYHTWADLDGLSLKDLADFPSDERIFEIAKIAFDEAEDLWMQLNVFLTDLQPNSGNHGGTKPGFEEWSTDDESDDDGDSADSPMLLDRLGDDQAKSLTILESERAVLERMLAQDEELDSSGEIRLSSVEDTTLNVACAKLLLDFDTNLRM